MKYYHFSIIYTHCELDFNHVLITRVACLGASQETRNFLYHRLESNYPLCPTGITGVSPGNRKSGSNFQIYKFFNNSLGVISGINFEGIPILLLSRNIEIH